MLLIWTVFVWLGIAVVSAQDVQITDTGTPSETESFYRVDCTVIIPSPQEDVRIIFDGPDQKSGVTSPTTSSGNTHSAVIIFLPPSATTDSGIYTCRAEVNGTTIKSAQFALIFAANKQLFLFPFIVRDPQPATVGANYTLTCEAVFEALMGEVTFGWLGPDGSVLPSSGSDTRSAVEGSTEDGNPTSTLVFRPLQEFHAGEYTCLAVFGTAFVVVPNAVTTLEVVLPDISVSLVSDDTPTLGDSLTFTCELSIANDINQTVSYTLLINGAPNSLAEPSVMIDSVSLADAGVYQCSVEIASPYINNNISLTSPDEEISLTIPSPTVVVGSDMPNPLPHLSSPTLTCNITLSDLVDVPVQLVVEWAGPGTSRQENVTLQASNSSYTSTLELSDLVRGEGDGNYVCSVSTSSNQLQQFIMDSETLSETVPIEVASLQVELNGTVYTANNTVLLLDSIGEGEEEALICRTDLTPCCNSDVTGGGGEGQWLFPNGSQILTRITGVSIYHSRGDASEITLHRRHNVQSPLGRYCCEVPTASSPDSDETFCVFLNGIEISTTPSAGTLIGQRFELHCSLGTDPGTSISSVTWTTPAGTVTSTADMEFLVLTIDPVTSDDVGNYTCSVTYGSTTLTRTYELVLIADPTAEITGDSNTFVFGDSITLTCGVSGSDFLQNSLLSYLWRREDVTLMEEVESSLMLGPLTAADMGSYTCTVTISDVTLSTDITVTSQGYSLSVLNPPPRLPVLLNSTAITTSSVTIQWTVMGPFKPDCPEEFVVMYGLSSGDLNTSSSVMTANSDSQTYSTQLNSLEVGTEYFFRVASSNTLETILSDVGSVTTNDDQPGEVSDLVQLNSPDDTTLLISWGEPASPNGDILGYSVTITNLRDGNTLVRSQDTATSDNTLREMNLEPGVPYNVSIAAVNRAGTGETTAIIIFTRQLSPSIAPRDVRVDRIASTNMVVSWQPLTLSEARGFISHYTVTYSPTSIGRKRQAAMTQRVEGMDASTATIGELDPDTVYNVQVQASTAAGDSIPSPLVAALLVTNPDPVVDVGALSGAAVAALFIIIMAITIIIITVLLLRARHKRAAHFNNASRSVTTYPTHFENPGATEEGLEYDYIRRRTRLGLGKDLSLEKYPTLERGPGGGEEGYEIMRPRKISALPLLPSSDTDGQGVDDDRVYETLRVKKNMRSKIPKSMRNDLEGEEVGIYETLRPKKKSGEKNSKASEDQNGEDGEGSDGGYEIPSIKKEEFSLKKCPAYNVPTIERARTGGGEKKDPSNPDSVEIKKADVRDENEYEIPIKKESFSLKNVSAREGVNEKKSSSDTPDNGEANGGDEGGSPVRAKTTEQAKGEKKSCSNTPDNDGRDEGGYEILLSAPVRERTTEPAKGEKKSCSNNDGRDKGGYEILLSVERAKEEQGVEEEPSSRIPSSESGEEKMGLANTVLPPQAQDSGEDEEIVDGTYVIMSSKV